MNRRSKESEEVLRSKGIEYIEDAYYRREELASVPTGKQVTIQYIQVSDIEICFHLAEYYKLSVYFIDKLCDVKEHNMWRVQEHDHLERFLYDDKDRLTAIINALDKIESEG